MKNSFKLQPTFLRIAISGSFVATMAFSSLPLHATTIMDFGTNSTTTTPSAPFTQNGLTMSVLNTGSTPNSHYDHYATAPFGTPTDNSAVVHTGNNGEEVSFSYLSGVAFDLLSIFSEGFLLDQDGDNNGRGLSITFTASTGSTHVIADTFGVGTIDFTGLSGWSNITGFKISAPLGVGSCGIAGNDCSNFGFDDITISAVPIPTAAWLFGSGLLGLIGVARRKTSHD